MAVKICDFLTLFKCVLVNSWQNAVRFLLLAGGPYSLLLALVIEGYGGITKTQIMVVTHGACHKIYSQIIFTVIIVYKFP